MFQFLEDLNLCSIRDMVSETWWTTHASFAHATSMGGTCLSRILRQVPGPNARVGGSTFPRLPQLNAKCIVHVLTPVLHYLTRTNICSWDYGSASPADSSRSLVGLSISNVACPSQNEHQWITEIHSAWCGLFATTAADTAAEADSEAATDPCTGTEYTP